MFLFYVLLRFKSEWEDKCGVVDGERVGVVVGFVIGIIYFLFFLGGEIGLISEPFLVRV